MRKGIAVSFVLLVGLVLLAVLGVQRFRTVHPTVAELGRLRVASLTYPGATVVQHRALEGDRNVMATNAAAIDDVACARAGGPQVQAWFHRELVRLGWRHSPPGAPVPGDGLRPTEDTWVRGERLFELRTVGAPPPPGTLLAGCPGGYLTHLQ